MINTFSFISLILAFILILLYSINYIVNISSIVCYVPDCSVYILLYGPAWFYILYTKKIKAEEEYLTAKKNKLLKWKDDIWKINLLISNKSKFILYLRDFSGGKAQEFKAPKDVYTVGGTLWTPFATGKTNYGKTSTASVFKYYCQKYSIVCLYNKHERTGFDNDVLILYPSDNEWFSLFKELLSYSYLVILDVNELSGCYSKSIKQEIETLSFNRKNIIYTGTKRQLDIFVTQFPDMKELILYRFDPEANFEDSI